MKFEVLILGNSSATPMYGRHPTAQVVNFNEQLFLIDCGEGTQMQLFRYGVKSSRINHIFISHLHGDHYLGLVGLISSQHLVGRKSDLHLYGPEPLQEILEIQFKYSDTRLRFNLVFHVTNPKEEQIILDTPALKVISFPLLHRIACTGFRFQEGARSATLRKERIEGANIPMPYWKLLKKGIDYTAPDGTVFKAIDYTYPAPKPRSYVYCSDTLKDESYFKAIAGADLLYHESTFLQEMEERAKETYHTTAKGAAEVAVEVGAKQLLLGHYSARYKDLTPLLEEAQAVFPNTMLSEEGKWFLVS
ncbi:ribonuclease Z [Sphingobacterium sp. UT-1RO-CII-1]|uniref:ribonuclease Z n=1 Tax=Sphingobacterium sp. UT-1RO-CII-1 TaxID=2995225 RepID=UPI00227A7EC2|nr:ribonuclease Z [Sphingobacterium sp. UT-1RO-CII-1]MCY4778287.1 ribonuclease Z [Sphingobacterium sp. UT-1RO-CII-1]